MNEINDMRKLNDWRKNVPAATDKKTLNRMKRQVRTDTNCEMQIRKILYAKGYRYRKNYKPIKSLNRRADIVFVKWKIAIFVDGCFWHRCPKHWKPPKNNAAWWIRKINSNVKRDKETTDILKKEGWNVIRAWEHEDPNIVANKIIKQINIDFL
jgi:DNA mismatch endonuclease (patch repair protein)